MRFLHTSDWHLGRTFHGGSLLDEQRAMVDAIVEIAEQHHVDAVIIAGDLFDRAIPPVEAVELWESAVARLRLTGAVVIAISGNHDSARRVSVHSRLLESGGVFLRGSIECCDEPILVESRHGAAPVAVYAVPYLDPVAARSVFGEAAFEPLEAGSIVADDASASDGDGDGDGADIDAETDAETDRPIRRRRVTHRSITAAAMASVRADLETREVSGTVVVAHTFVGGGVSSESERDITLGNVEQVPLTVFEGIGYVALGHLHGPQVFEGGRITYSGSPLPYSFSEEHHRKCVRIIDLDADGAVDVETVQLPAIMRLATLSGTLDDLLHDSSFADHEGSYVRAQLTDVHLPLNAMARLRDRFARAVELRHTPTGSELTGSATINAAQRRELPPLELTRSFFNDQEGRDPTDDELEWLDAALAQAMGVQR